MLAALLRISLGLMLFFPAFAQETTDILEQRTLKQPLHHGQPDQATFEQKIQILKPAQITKFTPIILFLGSEAGPGDLRQMAAPFQKQGAVIAVQADHRGYGSYSEDEDQSIPTYVNMNQAVEDFHHVVNQLKSEFSRPILAVGYSYSATLAILLVAKYPNDLSAIYASSATVHFPKESFAHDQKIRSQWPTELYKNLSAKIQSLSPVEIGDAAYADRLFLQTVFVGSVQYKKFAALVPYLEQSASLPTPQFIATWKGLDQQLAKGTAYKWSSGQNALKLSLTEAKTLQFHSRYWAYQQCAELGSFFISQQSDSLFPQTFDDYTNYCLKMFGIKPQVQKDWTIRNLIEKMNTPIIVINGANDPWFDIQISPSSKLPPGSQYFLASDGFHCPDRENPNLEAEAISAFLKLAVQK